MLSRLRPDVAFRAVFCPLRLVAGGPKGVTFSEFSGPSKLTRKLGFAGISVPSRDGELSVIGLKRAAALDFISAANSAWQNHFIRQVEAVGGELRALAEAVERLQLPKRYPSACLLDPFLTRATIVLVGLPKMDLVGRHQTNSGVMMVLVIPCKEPAAECASLLDGFKVLGEL